MKQSSLARRAQTAFSTFIYVAGGAGVGTIVGGAVARFTSSATGLDQVSDVLGGIGVGIMVSAVLTLGTARRLKPARRFRIGIAFLLLSAVAIAALQRRGSTGAVPGAEPGAEPSTPTSSEAVGTEPAEPAIAPRTP